MTGSPSIVLVHGAWADGSCWSGVIERLQADGHKVTAPQFPLTSLADDVDRLRHVLSLQDEPTVVAGHSYGGQIITALGEGAPNMVGLVFIAAFGLDQGESLGGVLSQGPTPPALVHQIVDAASSGCPKTTSSDTSPLTSTRHEPESCSPYSSRSRPPPSAT